jgi:formylmethanofuran dehydrogenase subunit B
MPMVGHYNMRGFNEALFKEMGFINRVKFEPEAVHDNKYSIIESLIGKDIDAIIVVGSDPISSLPRSVLTYLASIPVICIDPCISMTSKIAAVTIPCASSGVESGGTAIRMDGKVVSLSKIITSEYMTDEEIMDRLMEAI